MNSFTLRKPKLLSPQAAADRIDKTWMMNVTGQVASVSGDCIELRGMTAPVGAVCELPSAGGKRCLARVIGFRNVHPILAPMERIERIAAGDPVRLVDVTAKLLVGSALCGRVIDAFGRPIDGMPIPEDLNVVSADSAPPDSLDRPPIDKALETGVRAIDTMLTCGVGQRLGIFAGSGVGKSTLLGMIARGTKADRVVIGMVGERGREVQEFIGRCLGKEGLAKSVVVVATSDRPAAQRVSAAWTATAIAESFRDEGHNVLLLVDSVTRFALAQRELGLAAGEPPTTRGYPPSVFNLLPRLVERAGRTSRGSITAFYTVLVEGDDNNEPIADALRGLLDGHIVLSRALAAEAHWPPIDVLESLSRLQPHLVTPEIAAAISEARRHLSEYRKSSDLISIGAYRAGSDPRVDRAIAMREPLRAFLTQRSDEFSQLSRSQSQLVTVLANTTAATMPPASTIPANSPLATASSR